MKNWKSNLFNWHNRMKEMPGSDRNVSKQIRSNTVDYHVNWKKRHLLDHWVCVWGDEIGVEWWSLSSKRAHVLSKNIAFERKKNEKLSCRQDRWRWTQSKSIEIRKDQKRRCIQETVKEKQYENVNDKQSEKRIKTSRKRAINTFQRKNRYSQTYTTLLETLPDKWTLCDIKYIRMNLETLYSINTKCLFKNDILDVPPSNKVQ